MRRTAAVVPVVVALAMLAADSGQAQRNRPADASSGDLVELDVLALDRDGLPVSGLQQSDFQIKEDGKTVEVKTFTAVAPAPEVSAPRQLMLLLDDSSVPMGGTPVVQGIAKAILTRMRPDDEVTVVRLNNERDEPFGDTETAVSRIIEYRAGVVPFQFRGTAERVLRVIASASRQFEAVEHRRKLVVCIGGPGVCNVLEPQPRGYNLLWPAWVEMMAATARANVSIYAVMPVHPSSRVLVSGGIIAGTGGNAFRNTTDFDRFIDGLWREAGEYYLLGYWPSASKRDLHSIDIKATRKGVRVRARSYR